MTLRPSGTAHILLDDRGRAWIDDTNTKVIEVVCDMLSGMSPEQIHEAYPDLSLAQIHAALSYYYDHQAAYDAEIEQDVRDYEALRLQDMNSPVHQKLRALGKIP